jgi:hypothetical protein
VKWSGLIRPPQLQHSDTDSADERTATWLELFFDLAFVLVVAELAVGLGDDRTLGGVLVFAGLFSSVWWAWAGFTFYANRFDTDDVVYRRRAGRQRQRRDRVAGWAVRGLPCRHSGGAGLPLPTCLCRNQVDNVGRSHCVSSA